MSVNKAIILGNVGKDPEIRYIKQGGQDSVKVATLSIATTKKYTDRDGKQREATEWHRVVVWRQLADFAEKYLTKGSRVYVEGELATREYDNAAGQKIRTTEIIAGRLELCGGTRKQEAPQADKQLYRNISETPIQEPESDDLPF